MSRSRSWIEAKGWLSLPTRKNFHGWHGDAWYDQHTVSAIPREVKLAIYLTDVRSGAFTYIKGSHRKQHPRLVQSHELSQVPRERITEVPGTAGSAVLFDTSGIHRQATPVLEPRQAVFLNYHDPSIPLQQEDIEYYRYHPLLLNAAFLGNLTPEGQRVLGFGDKRNYQHGFERRRRHVLATRLAAERPDALLHLAMFDPMRLSKQVLVALEPFYFSDRVDRALLREAVHHINGESPRALLDMSLRLHWSLPERRSPPLLVLGARGDRICRVEDVEATARHHGVAATVVDGLAHMLMLEPEWNSVAQSIADFVDDLPRRA